MLTFLVDESLPRAVTREFLAARYDVIDARDVVLRVPEGWAVKQRAERLLAGINEAGLEQARGAITIVEPSRTRIFGPPSRT